MQKLFLTLAIVLSATAAHADTLEVKVDGLNCALCSDQMRASLLKAADATAIEPKLECGVIFLETEKSPVATEAALGWTLTSHGFNLKSVERSRKTLEEVRNLKC
ncbi:MULTISPECIES: hypothetical protein [unclassified Variovorax]|uniref:hypothetical protein n=1 Tax=unclassified Variovorax TaxID=663243 RepID=UPI00076BE46A|nr:MULTISPECIES: hypothetical protein [unclassified Variovorax]KWT95525.1 hypothetical protein APY03_2402 [Variovorax sp. WDL1]PNG50128.1 hypothetical protein CHC06_05751 [Variovorax sp. B2]PNG51001.1 hypothetical protein CHC07_05657 [Variovorax sp. B4]VTU41978.1 hypothetical protein SRS16P1_00168 [Variovorax sp. SRS16]VTU42010.1 hypothetical protein E5P1_00166 [Variovorax sp. PBL-E5]